jgi:hypothetical protein
MLDGTFYSSSSSALSKGWIYWTVLIPIYFVIFLHLAYNLTNSNKTLPIFPLLLDFICDINKYVPVIQGLRVQTRLRSIDFFRT